MTREERRRIKELKEYLKVRSKELARQFSLKKKDYMFYCSKQGMFYSMMFFMTDNYCIKISFYAKPLWVDDLLWDILKMSSNKKEPISLRGVGAFTIHAQMEEYSEAFGDEADIERIVPKYFARFQEFLQGFDEDAFLEHYRKISWQQEMVHVIVLIHENRETEALDYLADRKIRDFVVGDKSFAELAVEYINGW